MTDEEADAADQQDSGSTGDPELDRQVADLEHKGEKVQTGIEETRSDWESKKQDQSVPGAVEEEEWGDEDKADEGDEDEADDEGPGDAEASDEEAGDEEGGDDEAEHEEDEGE